MKKALLIIMVLVMALSLPAWAANQRGIESGGAMTRVSPDERRTALVIGNSEYEVGPLKNPANDARAVSTVLRKIGFDVISLTDQDQRQMKRAIRKFGKKIRKGGVGLFYFAGHGIQVGGLNYLIPLEAMIEAEEDVELEGVDVRYVMAEMAKAGNRLNIVILDACRNNPFARSFRSGTSGLATMDAPTGTLVAYATSPGKVASDGSGSNGLYTEALIEQMSVPGQRIEDVFKAVRRHVLDSSQGRQTPWESSSLTGDFYLVKKPPPPPPTTTLGQVASIQPGPTTTLVRPSGTLMTTTTSTQPLKIEIKRPPGKAVITSNVAGAKFKLAGHPLETVKVGSIVISNLPAGTYPVVAKKKGYKTWRSKVEIKPGQQTKIMIKMASNVKVEVVETVVLKPNQTQKKPTQTGGGKSEVVETIVLNPKKSKPRQAPTTTLRTANADRSVKSGGSGKSSIPPAADKVRSYRTNMGSLKLKFSGNRVSGTAHLIKPMTLDMASAPGPSGKIRLKGRLRGRVLEGTVHDSFNHDGQFRIKFSKDFKHFQGNWYSEYHEGFWESMGEKKGGFFSLFN